MASVTLTARARVTTRNVPEFKDFLSLSLSLFLTINSLVSFMDQHRFYERERETVVLALYNVQQQCFAFVAPEREREKKGKERRCRNQKERCKCLSGNLAWRRYCYCWPCPKYTKFWFNNNILKKKQINGFVGVRIEWEREIKRLYFYIILSFCPMGYSLSVFLSV